MKTNPIEIFCAIIPISMVYFFLSFLCLVAGFEEGAAWINALLIGFGLFFAATGIGVLRGSGLFRTAAMGFSITACAAGIISAVTLWLLTLLKHPAGEFFSLENCLQFLSGWSTYHLICSVYFIKSRARRGSSY